MYQGQMGLSSTGEQESKAPKPNEERVLYYAMPTELSMPFIINTSRKLRYKQADLNVVPTSLTDRTKIFVYLFSRGHNPILIQRIYPTVSFYKKSYPVLSAPYNAASQTKHQNEDSFWLKVNKFPNQSMANLYSETSSKYLAAIPPGEIESRRICWIFKLSLLLQYVRFFYLILVNQNLLVNKDS